VKDEKSPQYGFKCLVIGYEWNPSADSGLRHLETELVYLAGMCGASLIKKNLQLPPTSGTWVKPKKYFGSSSAHFPGIHFWTLSGA